MNPIELVALYDSIREQRTHLCIRFGNTASAAEHSAIREQLAELDARIGSIQTRGRDLETTTDAQGTTTTTGSGGTTTAA